MLDVGIYGHCIQFVKFPREKRTLMKPWRRFVILPVQLGVKCCFQAENAVTDADGTVALA
jgi:hypothetical protein